MKYRVGMLLTCAIFLFNVEVLRGQTVPWPPDVAKLFTNAVRVIKVETMERLDPLDSTLCGNTESLKRSRTWALQINPKDNHSYLCDLESGYTSRALPDDYNWVVDTGGSGVYADGLVVEPSPDSEWLLLIGASKDDVTKHVVTAFSYNLKKDSLISLGSLRIDASPYSLNLKWATNTTAIIDATDWEEWSIRRAYVVDVSQANSIETAIAAQRFRPMYYDNPPRLESLDTPSSEGAATDPNHINCTRTIYDVETHTSRKYSYGNICVTEYGSVSGTGYYRDIRGKGIAAIVRYNPTIGVRKALYQGEVERIFWVSPDEHYALLVLDDNGRIDNIPGFEYFPGGVSYPEHPMLTLVALQTGKILFSTPTTSDATLNDYLNEKPLNLVEQLSQNTLLLLNLVKLGDEMTSAVLRIENDHVVMKTIPGTVIPRFSSNGQILVWGNAEAGSTAFSLYDPVTYTQTSLVKDYLGYVAQIERFDNGVIVFSILPQGQTLDLYTSGSVVTEIANQEQRG